METSDLKKYAAELIGACILVLAGCGSVVIAGSQIGLVGIALTFGLAVLVMVYAIGGISGCHINPAITIAMRVAGKIGWKDTIVYIVVQCIGAIIGSGILLAMVVGKPGYSLAVSGLGQNGYGVHSLGGYPLWSCFLTEVVLTALFLFVVFGSTSKDAPKGFAGLSIGLSLTLIHLVGIPISGTSVNPARSLGPAVFVRGDAFSQVWLFWAAPIIGGILAALLWRLVFEKEKKSE